ncbi:MAG TPA: AsmA family protein [Steroidobacteraceae bacterium]|nr:AsmA family protein [Steroidobacteraceae bacterium]
MKVVAWVLGGLIALIAIVLITVVIVVDPNDYKDEIAQAVKDRTGRDLTLEGDLKLSVFPWLALETGRAQLGNAPGFGQGPFLTLERADVGVKLIPLLSGEMQVRRLEIEGLRVNLVKDAQGKTNWADLTEPKAETPPPPQGKTEIPSIAGVSVKNSSLDYRDLANASRTRLEKLDLETGRIESGEPVELQLEFAMDEGEGTPAKFIRMKTVATLDTEAERYSLADLELDATLPPEGEQKGDAREMQVALRSPSLVADLKAQTLALPKFELSAAGAKLAGALQGAKILDAPAFTGTLALAPVSPRDLMQQLGIEAPQTRDPEALKSVAFDARLNATDKSAMLEDLTLTLDQTRATGTAGIADFDKTALRFDLAVDQLDLDRYSGPEEEKKESAADDEPVELPVEALRKLNAQGKLRIGQLTVAGLKMSDVQVNVDAIDGLVRVNPSQAKLYGGAHRGSIALDARGDAARLSVDETLTSIDFASLFREMFESERVMGQGNLKAVLAGRGNDTNLIKNSLDGRIEFNVQNGAIKGADLWWELRRARALFDRQPAPAQPSTGETRFKSLQGTAEVRNGVLENRDLVIDAEHLKVTGEGKFEIPTGKVDYRLTANITEVPPEGAGAEMASLRSAQIPVRVSGTLQDLKIRPDVQGLAKAQVNEKVEEKKQELTEKLSRKLGDLFNKKKPPEETPKP